MASEIAVEYHPPPDCGTARCRDMFMDSIYIVVIPCGVLFLVVFITSIILCCSSCKRKKKEIQSDETQLLGYNSIRRASLSLRQLSHNRDTPLLSSRADRTASLNLDRDSRYRRGNRGRDACSSAPGTLQRDRHRHHRDRHSELLPPEYRVPPSYSSGDVNTGSGVEYTDIQPGIVPSSSVQQDPHLT